MGWKLKGVVARVTSIKLTIAIGIRRSVAGVKLAVIVVLGAAIASYTAIVRVGFPTSSDEGGEDQDIGTANSSEEVHDVQNCVCANGI